MVGKSVSIKTSVATSAYNPTTAPVIVPPTAAAMVSSTLDLFGGGGGLGLLSPNDGSDGSENPNEDSSFFVSTTLALG